MHARAKGPRDYHGRKGYIVSMSDVAAKELLRQAEGGKVWQLFGGLFVDESQLELMKEVALRYHTRLEIVSPSGESTWIDETGGSSQPSLF